MWSFKEKVTLTLSRNSGKMEERVMKCVCGATGWKVKKITVGNHVNPEYWHLLSDDFYFCPNPKCEVVYFNGRVTFTTKEVKTKVFLKEKGSPRPLCYCKHVTVEDVIEAIKNGAKGVEEVEKLTGMGNGGFCTVTNPTGRCCKQFYEDLINELLAEKAKFDRIDHVQDSCCCKF